MPLAALIWEVYKSRLTTSVVAVILRPARRPVLATGQGLHGPYLPDIRENRNDWKKFHSIRETVTNTCFFVQGNWAEVFRSKITNGPVISPSRLW